MADPVQLFDSPHAAHGRRYTDVDRENAYLAWRLAAGRSLRKAGEITGVAASTLGTWQQADGWTARADADDKEDAESARASILALATAQLARNVAVAVAIRDDETGKVAARDKLDAIKWLSGIAGVAPVTKAEIDTRPAKPVIPKKRLADYMSAPDHELED